MLHKWWHTCNTTETSNWFQETLKVFFMTISLCWTICVMPQFDWLCDVCGCVMSPTSGIYWVKLGFINNYKKPQLWLVLLRYSADVASVFSWVVTYDIRANPVIPCGLKARVSIPYRRPFQFGYWNEIFRYRSVPMYRFGFTAIYNNNSNNNNFLRAYTFYVV